MLPDYPLAKEKIYRKLILKRVQAIRNAYMGPLADIPTMLVHEGNMLNDTGTESTETSRHFEAIRSIFEFRNGEIDAMTPEQMLQRIDEVAQDMACQQGDMFMRYFSETASASGQVIDAGGQPLDTDMLLLAIEKMDLEFDAYGQPNLMQLVVTGPDASRFSELLGNHLSDSAEYGDRYSRIIERKREEWRDRESARKLVG